MTPTEEQLKIIEAGVETTDNLLIEADAGAAKTSSLVMLAEKLPPDPILCLAFNKKIAVEMQERLPPNCKAMTLNALGHRTWMEATGRRLKIDTSKTHSILTNLVATLPRAKKETVYEQFADYMKLISFGKQCGYVPTGHYERGRPLLNCEEFFAHLDRNLEDWEEDLIREATLVGLREAFVGNCDFDDQIFMPTIFQGAFPRYPLVLVDETQDLSALNHATLRKLVKKRIIAVGDSKQAIYGFRGAHEDSMKLLKNSFNMKELYLTISFRCSKKVTQEARWRAPKMKWPEWAKEGNVTHLASWSAADIPETAAIICRNNAPLFSIAIKLLQAGRNCELSKSDVGKTLIKILSKLGDKSMLQEEVFTRIENWKEKELQKYKKHGASIVNDRAECLKIFASHGANLDEILAHTHHILNAQGPIKLLTGHGAKGLEFNDVFFLDQNLLSKEGQDPNLRYVIQTRAKENLYYVNSDGFCS